MGLPSKKEIYESIISTKIAVHSGYIARTNDYSRDFNMAKARMKNGCIGEIDAAIDPLLAKISISKHKYYNGKKQCEMCGANCSLDILENISNKKQMKT